MIGDADDTGDNQRIADLLTEWRQLNKRRAELRIEMVRMAVEVLKLPQSEVQRWAEKVDTLLDGYLLGQGVRQSWRQP